MNKRIGIVGGEKNTVQCVSVFKVGGGKEELKSIKGWWTRKAPEKRSSVVKTLDFARSEVTLK